MNKSITSPGIGAIEGTEVDGIDEESEEGGEDLRNSCRRLFTASELGLGKIAKRFPCRTKITVGI